MTLEELSTVIVRALKEYGSRTGINIEAPRELVVERPRDRNHGDWSTNVALQTAKKVGLAPRELAAALAGIINSAEGIESCDVGGPGFINITLAASVAGRVAAEVVAAGSDYGRGTSMFGHVVNMEFVSANPTGPLHLGHTRWAALGDAIARLLVFAGAQVTSEYYINDAGTQMNVFGDSVLARMRGREIPEGGYPGEYISEIAEKIESAEPALVDAPDDRILDEVRQRAYELQLNDIKKTLIEFDVRFDVWFSEKSLHDSGALESAVTRLREQGHVFDRGGAVWLRTTDFTDDKDRVLIRSDGAPTYFAADAAYYLNKKDRGYDRKIYLLGADHHGYVGRLKAIASAAGDDANRNIEILIGQLINVNGAKLSKRAGNIIELRDLVRWLGRDALRYSLARIPADSPLTLDPEVLRSASNENPVYYVQYAHARACGVDRRAAEAGITTDAFKASALNDPTESALLAALADFPRVVAQAAEIREPHRLARYLESLASLFHKWYSACRVTPTGDEVPGTVHSARLMLDRATAQVLANGLNLLGVGAPENM
ncbi:arginine--tRNA ligase [Brevibacterium aurantiacum]|uniref:Arginine--tRNA ligase n=1 Tax=Brevibacterium aurantiacum TaxID=273384 RepID=A0A1D7W0X9_BREAU|nr:arginine--tRNA ligase [Brevibacterium aurantiacum]AOP52675.1 Arginyl-tRNA synthetase [Brevibacterium aurantiacum]RCS95395.1 arginine--tRNA ligase [Brevibacterium aurantiacum]